jgi:hypothetical protein
MPIEAIGGRLLEPYDPLDMPPVVRVVASCGQNLYLFQMIRQIDKIPRRDAIAANKRLFGLSFH